MEDYCDAIMIPGFEKVKMWNDMRYDELNELMIMLEKKGEKLNMKEYCEIIMNDKLLNFWIKSMKNIEYILVMKNEIFYHKEIVIKKRKKYEVMN